MNRWWWKHLRAVLVTTHLAAILLTAIPAPVGGMHLSAWQDPTVQAEFATWASALGVTPAVFEEKLFALANFWMDLRFLYLRPVEPYIAFTGTDQPWRMFVGADRFPTRFQVQVRPTGAEPAGFVTLFEERSPERRWHELYFRPERIRSVLHRYGPPNYAYYAQLHCEWLAKHVFAEQRDAAQVRCRFWKQRSPSPEQARAGVEAGPGGWVNESVVSR
jgi:hypothetical protein